LSQSGFCQFLGLPGLFVACGTKKARKAAGQKGESSDRQNQANDNHKKKDESFPIARLAWPDPAVVGHGFRLGARWFYSLLCDVPFAYFIDMKLVNLDSSSASTGSE
jgi:hypothetical protein